MVGRQKHRGPDSLPLLDDVFQQSSSTKFRVMENFASLSQVDFQRDTFVDLKAIPESAKVCWIFTRFSVQAVMNAAHHVLSLPTGLTESQRNQRIADCAGLSVKDAEFRMYAGYRNEKKGVCVFPHILYRQL